MPHAIIREESQRRAPARLRTRLLGTWKIAGKKHAGAKTVDGVTEMELALHLQRGETDVNAIEIVDDVEQEKKWNETPN